jgi:hypothetical protein
MRTLKAKDASPRTSEIKGLARHREERRIAKQVRAVGNQTPAKPSKGRRLPPDFMAILKRIYGTKMAKMTGADLVSAQIGQY